MYEENTQGADFTDNNDEQADENNGAAYLQAVREHEDKAEKAAAQGAEKNARFAAARRHAEAQMREENLREQWFKENISWLHNPQTNKPFESNAEWEDFKKSSAQQHGEENASMPKQASGTLSDMRKILLEGDPEVAMLRKEVELARQSASNRVYEDVLSEIKAEYPDEKAGHIIEFGETFLKMCAAGVNALTAYEAVRKNAGLHVNAPGMGDIGKGSGTAKDFFTPEQVDRMSQAEVEKNYALIRKSMTHWKA